MTIINPHSWRDETRQLLIDRPRSLTFTQIADDLKLFANQDVSVAWLKKFASGDIEGPSVVLIQALSTYLKNKA